MESKNKLRFHLVLIRPEGYVHSSAFSEIAETLIASFGNLGIACGFSENEYNVDSINIILGAHLIDSNSYSKIPRDSIIYNFEQLAEESPWVTSGYMRLITGFRVWDYSLRNMQFLEKYELKYPIVHMPVGYAREMSRIEKAAEQDIDVLFYGSLNTRRGRILDELSDLGYRVERLCGVYGTQRDEWIARSKLILNIHYYKSKILEIARVSYLLANKKAVVSECDAYTEVEPGFEEALALVPYGDLVGECQHILKNSALRKEYEAKGFEIMSQRDQTLYLEGVVESLKREQLKGNKMEMPKQINMGSGKDFRNDYLNIDFSEHWNPDVVMDFSDGSNLGKLHQTTRFGEIVLTEGVFEKIISNDVLEHIPDLTSAMTNCLKLLKYGGVFEISVPYDLSYGAWQDPTHVRAFNERSWLYYTDWFWYLGWKESRFEIKKLDYILSASGRSLSETGVDEDVLTSTPRAIDSMEITLQKRSLTPEEIGFSGRVNQRG